MHRLGHPASWSVRVRREHATSRAAGCNVIQVLGRAALLSGTLCRVQGYDKDSKLRALQDCALFLQAQRLGLVVLTANVSDYDILLQLIPTGRVLFYRHK